MVFLCKGLNPCIKLPSLFLVSQYSQSKMTFWSEVAKIWIKISIFEIINRSLELKIQTKSRPVKTEKKKPKYLLNNPQSTLKRYRIRVFRTSNSQKWTSKMSKMVLIVNKNFYFRSHLLTFRAETKSRPFETKNRD